MKGYKVFNPDWTCRGFQYEVGKTFEENVMPSCCQRGFHFCTNLIDCFNYCRFDPENKVAEVEAIGDIDAREEDTKHCTNKIKIIREMSWAEVLDMVNTGVGNSGYRNSGHRNSGNYNSGYCNSGNGNSGDRNSGNHNAGDYNSGHCNSGSHNSGDYNGGDGNSGNHNAGDGNSGNHNAGDGNSGNHNAGDGNSGNYNSGYCNSGNCNSGYRNSGHCNSGYRNSGNCNSGDYNSGDYNSGDGNSGNHNSGYYNSGHYNSTSYSSGCFNTKETRMTFFNKISDWTFCDWLGSRAKEILSSMPSSIRYIRTGDMTEKEKEEHPEFKVTGGYLKVIINCERERQVWWDNLLQNERETVMRLPNYDAGIFKKITGIEVRKGGSNGEEVGDNA